MLIRPAQFPDDKPAILSFIDGMQQFEHAIEPDRRIDAQVAEEFFAALSAHLAADEGLALVAEEQGSLIGWAAVYRDENDVYVRQEERVFANISELYVVEAARGRGVGRALIRACEDWARNANLNVVMIGVLRDNGRAHEIYSKAGFETYYIGLRKYLR
jgi:GNAT superfamily N-acetyltransferase